MKRGECRIEPARSGRMLTGSRFEDAGMIISCPHCQAKNRVLAERFNDEPTCGGCGKALLSGKPVALTDDSFGDVLAAIPKSQGVIADD